MSAGKAVGALALAIKAQTSGAEDEASAPKNANTISYCQNMSCLLPLVLHLSNSDIYFCMRSMCAYVRFASRIIVDEQRVRYRTVGPVALVYHQK